MSKTNQFGEEAFIFLGRAPPGGVCPVSALLANVAARGPQDGPLFLWPNGAPLTRGQLVDGLRAALDKAGVESERFGEHSLQIGAATEAARLGASTAVIQALGRWRSNCYMRYVRIPEESLAGARALVGGLQGGR